MKPTPRVSVVMPMYNSQKYLREAIDSILNQTYQDFELILLNDGSTDNTEAIVQTYLNGKHAEKIRYHKNPQNIGIAESYNKLVKLAKGDYIAIAEHDDLSHPQRLKIQAEFLDHNPHVAVVSTKRNVFSGTPPTFAKIPLKQRFAILDTSAQIRSRACFFHYPLQFAVAMIRSKTIATHHISFNANYTIPFDYDALLHLAWVADLVNLQPKLLTYREHETNSSSSNKPRNRVETSQIKLEFAKQHWGEDVTNLWNKHATVTNRNDYDRLATIVEKIVHNHTTTVDSRFDHMALIKQATSYLYKQLRELEKHSDDYAEIYVAYRQTKLLKNLPWRKRALYHIKAVLPQRNLD